MVSTATGIAPGVNPFLIGSHASPKSHVPIKFGDTCATPGGDPPAKAPGAPGLAGFARPGSDHLCGVRLHGPSLTSFRLTKRGGDFAPRPGLATAARPGAPGRSPQRAIAVAGPSAYPRMLRRLPQRAPAFHRARVAGEVLFLPARRRSSLDRAPLRGIEPSPGADGGRAGHVEMVKRRRTLRIGPCRNLA